MTQNAPSEQKGSHLGRKKSTKNQSSYNEFKEFQGRKYTGMKVGRSHKWIYDKGEWREKKVSPDEWTFSYSVNKTRAWKAPECSGAPVGAEYHWYILADQVVKKLDANIYTTAMTGVKHKLAHRRAGQENWNITELAQKRRLILTLEKLISQLKEETESPSISKSKLASVA